MGGDRAVLRCLGFDLGVVGEGIELLAQVPEVRARHVENDGAGVRHDTDKACVGSGVIELLGRELGVREGPHGDDLALRQLITRVRRACLHLLSDGIKLLGQRRAVRSWIERWQFRRIAAAAVRRFIGVHRGNFPSEEREPRVGHGSAPGRDVASLQLLERVDNIALRDLFTII